ncbi:hypothetical protein [Actinomadura chokoriensis]|uniref:Uncharacterized protein n=1 Tax=Actinomadura chokoriensis TaxID=454156 RepID=A0ABV4R8C6_9ACTN
MTSISVPTCKDCDRLTTSDVPQPRRPRFAVATSKDGHRILRPSLRRITAQLRAAFGSLSTDNRLSRQTPSQINTGSKMDLLARAFGHPDGAGFIGPGADALLRGMFTEALVSKSDVAQVITTRADLYRLFGEAFDESVTSAHATRLCIMESLEDAIEHLELEAEMTKMINVANVLPLVLPATIWLTTPGPDSDVVHQALRHWPDSSVLALISGPWPYGPTHLIEETGPRPLPSGPLPLPSPQEAIDQLPIRCPE